MFKTTMLFVAIGYPVSWGNGGRIDSLAVHALYLFFFLSSKVLL